MAVEYRTMHSDGLPSAEQLEELATEGWRLVTIVILGNNFFVYLIKETIEQAQPSYVG